MSLKLIKILLNKEFYDRYKHKISLDMLPPNDTNVKGIFLTLGKAFETVETDLTVDSLQELHYIYNPALSGSHKKVLEGIFADLKALDITKDTGELILKKAIEQYLWTEMANMSVQGADGLATDFLKAQEILDEIRSGINLHKEIRIVSDNIDDLLQVSKDKHKWQFHLSTLRRRIPGIGPNTFTLVPARTNVGKTGIVTSFIFQPSKKADEPGGFLHQGARVVYVGNEESADRTKLRGICCLSGYSETTLMNDPDKKAEAQELFNKLKGNLTVIDAVGYSIEELYSYVKDRKGEIDILAVDVLDKLSIGGKFDNDTERLYKLYTAFRELGKKFDIANIGTCQASVDAENQLVFGTDSLAGSKTGKGGELDLCLCLGRKLNDDGTDNLFRTINIAKNKLNGVDGNVSFSIELDTCRIKA